jgi:DNA-binding MarR family transcriptional regulator
MSIGKGQEMSNLRKDIKQTRGFESLEQETHLNLIRTASELGGPFLKFLKQYDLSPSLYNILRILRGQKGEGLSCSGIGERMVSRESDITRLIDRLLKMDLVERVRSLEDRRVVLTNINKKGLALLTKLDAPMLELNKESLKHMTINDKKELNRLLVKARSQKTGD